MLLRVIEACNLVTAGIFVAFTFAEMFCLCNAHTRTEIVNVTLNSWGEGGGSA